MTFDELREAFKDQVRGLIDGGCDLLLLETIVDTLNAKAGIVAIEEGVRGARRPAAADDLGHDHRPQRPDAVRARRSTPSGCRSRTRRPFSVGINCALGARDMRPYLAELARIADCYVSCYPNAGLPNAFGEYDEQPADTASALRDSPTAASSTSSAAAAARRRITSGRSRRRWRHCRRADRAASPPVAEAVAVRRPRDAHDPARQQLPDDRRADQRHRFGASSPG